MKTIFTNASNDMNDYAATGLTTAITIQLVDGLTMTKTAEKGSWADGELTFTLIINNTSAEAYTGAVINDILDPEIMALVPNSVILNGISSTNYTYNETSGQLVLFPDETVDVSANGSITVTFRVKKV